MTARLLHYSDVENAYDDPERIARLAAVLADRADEGTIVCGTGDVVAPGFLSMETDGQHASHFFEAVSPDVSTFGNHDFDLGTDVLREVVAASPQTWLTANLRESGTGEPFGADAGVRETAIREVSGDRIGFFGVTNPPSVRNHALADEVEVADPIDAARRAKKRLRERGVDHVVALSHLGSEDEQLVEAVDVDAVLGGHTHGERATVEDGTALTRPGARGRRVARVELRDTTPEIELLRVPEAPPSGPVADRYRQAFAEAGLNETVDTVTEPITRRPVDTYPESRIGNAVADAFRWVADADVAVCNAKILRAGPPLSGEVTLGDLRATAPFQNDVWSAELSGRELRQLLEGAGDPEVVDTATPEVFAHVSGANLRWRRDGSGLELDAVTVDDDPLGPEESYLVAAPTFAFLNDLFEPLERDRRRGTHGDQHDALAAYVRNEGLPESTDGRMQPVDPGRWDDTRSL